MSDKDTGGPAFPRAVREADGSTTYWHGMTLRDYFAAMAMQGLLANPRQLEPRDSDTGTVADVYAYEAYVCADAMLKERSK